jgi:uncharacterized protein (TIGR03435 family)
MLQDLLVKRFGLAVHWEERDLPVYGLMVAKGGLRMKEAEKPPAGAPAPAPPIYPAGYRWTETASTRCRPASKA